MTERESLTRRQFLGAASAAGLVAAAGPRRGTGQHGAPAPAQRAPTTPPRTRFDHVVVVMMENRSFDHILGWLPGADGIQDPVTPRFPDQTGRLRPNYHLTVPMGCAYRDPDHSYDGGRFERNGGALNNFARGRSDEYAIGFYNEADRPFMSALARHYTTCDRYFCSVMAPTYPNRLFLHAGQSDRPANGINPPAFPAIWDQLNHPGGPTGRYYFSDVPFLALWGSRYRSISAPYQQFLADARAGTLPNVAYVDPRFIGAGKGGGNDDHPHAHIGAGDAFLSEVFWALARGPAWSRTVFIVTYDEWGGFYDHVPPPRVTPGLPIGADPRSGFDQDMVDDKVLLGFRVPCIVASPFTRGRPETPRLDHALYDHTSILKLIETRFGLHPLTQRDASTQVRDPADLLSVLDPITNDPQIPTEIPQVSPPTKVGCSGHAEHVDDTWSPLLASDLVAGWDLPGR